MPLSDEYRYQLIVLVVVVFLICIFYPPDLSCLSYSSSSTQHDEDSEKFSIKENPGTGTINGVAELYASRIANSSYKNVVEPCSRVGSQANIVNCITGYNDYFNSVLKEHVIDMFTKLKELNGVYVDYITEIKTKEQMHFAQHIADAFSSAMSDTMKYLSEDYSSDDKYDKEVFTQILTHYLVSSLKVALNKIFGVAPASTEPKKIPFVNPDTNPSAKTSTHPTDRAYYLTCRDLNSGKFRVYVDGLRLMCQNQDTPQQTVSLTK
ncbi:hypothetical protein YASMINEVIRUS_319 [Yasminevirus sp. GU-2018]|uniref:Uncharacterized protein n=1 Tax=Yasminevirus sp. GU-2018 TaxID=2420051 RepID=A0A5K0U9S2_9VIRU|nr:hypothetical protein YASMINEVIRUS_319 [Yasminevirus sp. GU-2018]